jgi:hypothetical protein
MDSHIAIRTFREVLFTLPKWVLLAFLFTNIPSLIDSSYCLLYKELAEDKLAIFRAICCIFLSLQNCPSFAGRIGKHGKIAQVTMKELYLVPNFIHHPKRPNFPDGSCLGKFSRVFNVLGFPIFFYLKLSRVPRVLKAIIYLEVARTGKWTLNRPTSPRGNGNLT